MPIFRIPVMQKVKYYDTGHVYVSAKDHDEAMNIIINRPNAVVQAVEFDDSSEELANWEVATEDFEEDINSLNTLKSVGAYVLTKDGLL